MILPTYRPAFPSISGAQLLEAPGREDSLGPLWVKQSLLAPGQVGPHSHLTLDSTKLDT